MKVLVCGYFLEGYPRYEILLQALRQLPLKIVDKKVTKLMGKLETIKYAVGVIKQARNADKVLVFSGNYLLVLALGLLRPYHKASVLFDLPMSSYIKQPNTISFIMERCSCKLSDKLLCPTPEYCEYYRDIIGISGLKLFIVPLAVQDIWLRHKKKEVE